MRNRKKKDQGKKTLLYRTAISFNDKAYKTRANNFIY